MKLYFSQNLKQYLSIAIIFRMVKVQILDFYK